MTTTSHRPKAAVSFVAAMGIVLTSLTAATTPAYAAGGGGSGGTITPSRDDNGAYTQYNVFRDNSTTTNVPQGWGSNSTDYFIRSIENLSGRNISPHQTLGKGFIEGQCNTAMQRAIADARSKGGDATKARVVGLSVALTDNKLRRDGWTLHAPYSQDFKNSVTHSWGGLSNNLVGYTAVNKGFAKSLFDNQIPANGGLSVVCVAMSDSQMQPSTQYFTPSIEAQAWGPGGSANGRFPNPSSRYQLKDDNVKVQFSAKNTSSRDVTITRKHVTSSGTGAMLTPLKFEFIDGGRNITRDPGTIILKPNERVVWSAEFKTFRDGDMPELRFHAWAQGVSSIGSDGKQTTTGITDNENWYAQYKKPVVVETPSVATENWLGGGPSGSSTWPEYDGDRQSDNSIITSSTAEIGYGVTNTSPYRIRILGWDGSYSQTSRNKTKPAPMFRKVVKVRADGTKYNSYTIPTYLEPNERIIYTSNFTNLSDGERVYDYFRVNAVTENGTPVTRVIDDPYHGLVKLSGNGGEGGGTNPTPPPDTWTPPPPPPTKPKDPVGPPKPPVNNPNTPPTVRPPTVPNDPGPKNGYIPEPGYPQPGSSAWNARYTRCFTTRMPARPTSNLRNFQVSAPRVTGTAPRPKVTNGTPSGFTTVPTNASWGATYVSNYDVEYSVRAGSNIFHDVDPKTATVTYTYTWDEEAYRKVSGPPQADGTPTYTWQRYLIPRSGSGSTSLSAWDGCGDATIPAQNLQVINPKLQVTPSTIDTGNRQAGIQDDYDMAAPRVKKDGKAQFSERLEHSWRVDNPSPVNVRMTPVDDDAELHSAKGSVPHAPGNSKIQLTSSGSWPSLKSGSSATLKPGRYRLTDTSPRYTTQQHDVDHGKVTAELDESVPLGVWTFATGRYGQTSDALVNPDGTSYTNQGRTLSQTTKNNQLITSINTDSFTVGMLTGEVVDSSGDQLGQVGENLDYTFRLTNTGSTVALITDETLRGMGANLQNAEYEVGFSDNKHLTGLGNGVKALYPGEQVIIHSREIFGQADAAAGRQTSSKLSLGTYNRAFGPKDSNTAITTMYSANPTGLEVRMVSKDDSKDGYVSPGEGVSYTYTVRNNSDAPMTGITLNAQGFTPENANIGTLQPGQSVVVTVKVPTPAIKNNEVPAQIQATGKDDHGKNVNSNIARSVLPTSAEKVIINTGWGNQEEATKARVAVGVGGAIMMIVAALGALVGRRPRWNPID